MVAVEIHVMTDQILTLKEVASYLKLAEKTAYKLAAEGKLPGFKVGGSWRFKSEDVESWIKQKKSEAGKKWARRMYRIQLLIFLRALEV